MALLQETVRRECQEREELTAALSQTQRELLGLQSLTSHQGSSGSPSDPTERHARPGSKQEPWVPLSRSLNSPNTLRPSPVGTDRNRGRGTDGGEAGRSLRSWNRGGVLGGEKREGTLPRLKAGSVVREFQCGNSLVMERKKRL